MNLEVSEDVVANGVSKVVKEVLEGAFTGDKGLDEVTHDGKHGKPTIFDLLNLQFLQGLLVLAKSKEVEQGSTRVGRVAGATKELLEAQEVLLSH